METMASQNQVFYGSLLYAISLIWALSILYKKETKKSKETYWMVIILALPFLGTIIYLLKHYTSGKKGKFATS
ncbi:PLDc N-terminal domain-containing protein [Flavobacterium sp. NKUCC04_CG]|uniref:PLDc N-terminal domain-containing protein n=1 Tax=Flavobacterium sp. NKUCC04_CG TaxID=2842121 RepID=UPI001C5BDCDC|nr:PLDc N-terminal domain-containing protein [Flavobacterium sp. NKUCC04_CG]MBW3520068.1 PLDc N-terminal domain-containing protein [Flavobacterium sp. NKUCC04_CG]